MMRRWSVANVVLGLLVLVGPRTIYDLNKHFEQGISLFYRASLGSLRSALAGLVERGEVEFDGVVERGRHKKVYRITETGRAAFDAWLDAPVTASDVETAALAKLFFLGLVAHPGRRRSILADVVERIERDEAVLLELEARIDAIEVPAEHAEVLRYQKATLEYGLASHRLGAEFFARLCEEERDPR